MPVVGGLRACDITVSTTGEWVEIAFAQTEFEAGLIVGKLAEAGIDSTSVTSSAAPGAWLTGSQPMWVPAKVLVPPDRVDEARRVLESEAEEADWQGEEGEDGPEMGIVAESQRRSGWYWVTVLLVAALLLGFVQSQLDLIRL
ncbi:MAG TPA: hypothetical protein VE174_04930 [Actinomycetota bacterium]|nr:hypothetical protein [Actinomycetota bacterium]